MRQQGRLTEWNDDRGFGFITPLAGGSRMFVHISAFPQDQGRPVVNDQVTYTVGRDRQGRPCAQAVLPLTPLRAGAAHSQKASRTFGVSALFLAIAIIAVVYVGREQVNETRAVVEHSASGNEAVASAFQEQRSGVQVTGEGVVTKVLPDDNDGSRHQRFIVRLASGQTLLIAHNIDLAPRLAALEPGDSVAFNGEYEWSSQGGIIHWTHHDPSGQHAAGWLKFNGQTYQ